jgi:UDP-2,4-diacetamido-2,4,6-trideoxy-beta-L-altropyranose hydrolase
MKILIRTGGGRGKNKELGLGHIFRTLNLAKRLKGMKIIFLIEDFGGAKEEIQEQGFKNIFVIQKKIRLENDIKNTYEIISKEEVDLVIIDQFKITKEYVEKINEKTKVVVISDLKNIDYRCNLLINGFIGFKDQKIHNKYNSKCLLGPSYQILNEEFYKEKQKLKKQFKILITFGGFDENNITQLILNILSKKQKLLKSKIILGPATPKNRYKQFTKKYKNIFEISQKTNNMFREISQSEFGICSGGITTYEFAKLGVPFGIICQSEHQLKTAKEWEKIGIGENLGLINSRTKAKVEKFLEKIEKKEIKTKLNGKTRNNEKGIDEIIKNIINLANSQDNNLLERISS